MKQYIKDQRLNQRTCLVKINDLLTSRVFLKGIAGFLLFVIMLSILGIGSFSAQATTNKSTSAVSVTVPNACTMLGGSSGTSTSGGVYSATIVPGGTAEISGSKLTTVCNDPNGYSIYAVGYGNDNIGITDMIGSSGNISTGTSGTSSSWWAMKINPVSGNNPTILNNFNNYHVVPSSYTQIAKYTSSTSSSSDTGAQAQTKYQVYVSSGQYAGTYVGKVKYTMVHPNNAAAPSAKTIATATTMQEVGECPSSLTVGSAYTLTDSRDGQSYKVAKLKDGNCWMVQNLKLGRTIDGSSVTSLTLTPSDSDVNSNYTLNYSDIPSGGRFHAYTIDGVEYQNNSTEFYCTGDGTASDWESCYYNWYTATARTGTTYVTSGAVNESICPAGWSLPTQAQFSALYNQYLSAALMEVTNPTTTKENSTPELPGFLLSGRYYTGGASNRGSSGDYWSRTADSAQRARDLYTSTSSVSPAYYNFKYLGCAIRCMIAQ